MKKYLLLILISSSTLLSAALRSTRVFQNFLVKITNNSSKTFKVYCSNNDWNAVLFLKQSQLEPFKEEFAQAIPKLQKEHNFLMKKKDNLLNRLLVKGKTFAQAEDDPELKRLNARLSSLKERLRPVVRPKSVLSDLPCRIFTPDDLLAQTPSQGDFPKAFVHDMPIEDNVINPILSLPETEVRGSGITIQLIDTDKTNDCDKGLIKVIAKQKESGKVVSLCTDNDLHIGRLHLIIEEDGDIKLEQLKSLPLR